MPIPTRASRSMTHTTEPSATPWEQVGGTSLAAPTWAGLIAIANQGRVASGSSTLDGRSQTLPAIYAIRKPTSTTSPPAGTAASARVSGYDMVTGIGSPKANLLVPDLAAYGTVAKLAVLAQPPGSSRPVASFGVSILVENSAGIVEQNFDGNVTISLGSDLGGGSLGGTMTVTAQNGVATFSGLTLASAGAGYTLLATAGGTAVTTSSFTVTPASARATGGDLRPAFRVVLAKHSASAWRSRIASATSRTRMRAR